MLSRIFSAFFILVLAGSVWAGVCGCAGGSGTAMKCCKKSSAQKSMGKKRCCASACGAESSSGSSLVTAEKGWRYSSEEAPAESPVVLPTVPFVAPMPVARTAGTVNLDLAPRPNPPDLFLLHRSLRL